MATDRKLDIFWFLSQLDDHKFDIFDTLDEEQKKEVSTYMLLRWMSGCDDPEQILKLGSIATACLFDLSKHPELMVKVLAACSTNGRKRYRWINYKGTSKETTALTLVKKEWGLTSAEAREAIQHLDNDDIMELAERHGLQPEELKALKKELG